MLIIGQNYLTGLHFSECACGWEALPSPQGFETREERDGVWSKGQPWYRSWSITTSTLLGKTKTEVIESAGGMAEIPLPEGIYRGA